MNAGASTLEQRITRRLRSVDYKAWRSKVESVGGCACPVRMSGEWAVLDSASGTVLASRSGRVFAPCGNRRSTVCPSCSDRYAADAFHLFRAGLSGGTKGVPVAVQDKPRVFATLTAPSFGTAHNRRLSARGRAVPCPCGAYHHPDDPRIGSPLDPESYDYVGAVLWQAHTGAMWHRFTIALRRKLAGLAGLTVREFTAQARVSYGKVAEYQRRGLVHFHAVIRIDGPSGPGDPCPDWATTELLDHAICQAARVPAGSVVRPDGGLLSLSWGSQVDIRHIHPDHADQVEDDHGQISEARLAGYVAKYATKGTGKTEAADRRLHSQHDIDHLVVTPHHRRLIQTCWDLGERAEYEGLNLRKWAHMLGFRGHFLTKSKHYSTTFGAIRAERSAYRAAEALERLGVTEDTVTVINAWDFTGIGYHNDAERELAQGIAQRLRQRHSTSEQAA